MPTPPTSTLPQPSRSKVLRRGRYLSLAQKTARWALALLLMAMAILVVGWLSLHWLILPHIDEWREPIEQRAGKLLGAPVRIGAISVRSGSWVPAIELRDVRVLDAEQRTAIALPHVVAALSARSLLAFELRFEQLLIDGASLDVRRDAAGRIRVGGLDFSAGSAAGNDDDDAAADWFFHQHEFAIRGGSLRWVDEARQAPPLVLGNVDLVVRNGLRGHDLRLDGTPPPEWGERFSVRGRFTQPLFARSGDWHRWSGTVFADLPRADVRELRRHVTLPFELSEGDGALRGWIDVEDGQARAATADVALRAVTLRLDKSVEPLDVEQVQGRIGADRKGERISVSARRLAFVTGDGLRWPQSDIDIAWRQGGNGDIAGGELTASHLDVGVMAAIASRVPLGKAVRELLADVHPQGVVSHLAARWQGPLDAPEHYAVKGTLSGLSLASRPGPRDDAVGRPGLSNASIDLSATEAGGEARIGVADGSVDLPGVFAEPRLALKTLGATLTWSIDRSRAGEPPQVVARLAAARFANADLHAELSATWRTGPGAATARGGRFPGRLELDGRIADADAGRTGRYLPLGLPDDVRGYIGRAVRAGTIASADIRIRGDLWDFPFHAAKRPEDGEFRIDARVKDLVYAYIPDADGRSAWPPLTRASGQLVIDRANLEIKDARAQLAGIDWSGVHGRVAGVGDAARLDVEGNARGALADMLRFVNATPVGRWTGRVFAATSASGAGELRLALGVPLALPAQSVVRGSLVLPGNDLRMTADTPLLAGTRARVEFTQKGFTVGAATARVLGGDLAFEGGSSNGLAGGDSQRFSGQGTLTAEALRHTGELGSLSRLAGLLKGQTAYRASLGFIGGRPQIQFASNLAGMAVDLPTPLGKAAATSMPLRVRTSVLEDDPQAPMRDTLQVELGGLLRAHFLREVVAGRPAMRGAVRIAEAAPRASPAVVEPVPALADIDEPLPLPLDGVHASIDLDRLDVDAWEAAASRLEAGDPASPGAAASTAIGTPASATGTAPLVFDASGGQGYVPDHIGLHVRELEFSGRRLSHVTAGLSQAAGLWRANVDADELDGYIEYRPARPGSSNAPGGVYARLARLRLPKGEAERVESLLEEPPASIPGLDIVVDEFELRGKRLGRLEIEAANRTGSGGSRDWELSKLNLSMPEARLQATGTWALPAGAARGAPRVAAMKFDLATSDSGALLERLGVGRVVRGGKGSLTGQLAWPGSPLSPDVARMTGDVKVAIEAGQFLKASPGAARLLGVLSLQSLPRRLLLDFRDVFAEGFAFDDVVGDVSIARGLATTNNLRMRGAAAAVLMEGSADLERETADLRVVVVPEINAGTASLAYAVINPAIGLGTFLAQYFLKKPLTAAITREFHVSGPWEDPKVERVERRLAGDAVPAAGATEPSSTQR